MARIRPQWIVILLICIGSQKLLEERDCLSFKTFDIKQADGAYFGNGVKFQIYHYTANFSPIKSAGDPRVAKHIL